MIQVLYLAVIFLTVFIVALVIISQLSPRPIQARLQQLAEGGQAPNEEPGWMARIVQLTGPLAKITLPVEGWENSQLRIRFMNAGYRGASAPVLFFASKTLLAILLPVVIGLYLYISGKTLAHPMMIGLALVGALVGYILPNVVLERRIANRKREIFDSFPDALDLTTVCVEAGLGLDAALARVGEEMRFKSPVLGEELHLVNLELRAGSTRERALRNLALRTGVEEIDTLVAMLVQSDRFGTSVADSLRVHSENLRTKRRLRAEESAAKIPLKLLFPLIFFIFPSLLLVLLGPAFINIYRVLLPTLGGH
ncbi:tight adherence protein C [Novimethylophilus kurashikiensis]|uniref:Tight adherence protein C n=1 Tax=Novimethylophilus kurashikiensis TaxID=1825523 RepID=A0A2R5F5F6_9PROT|nr:type II secretion system F family protein [Novimethylophilus kurashikiensis]GBG13159.1 tight adherence protein C [Novimethylophilus kurashikiensis]